MTNNVVINAKLKEELFEQYRKKPVVVSAYQTDVELDIETLEGTMRADPGDYIIKGVKGEPYPCKPDIFAATYEKANKPKTLSDYLKEWETSIDELEAKSSKLTELTRQYRESEFKILTTFDFKAEYGKDNDKIRNLHIQTELKDLRTKRQDLELRIDYLKRRIEFVKRMIDLKVVGASE